jgi:hypothetical protein
VRDDGQSLRHRLTDAAGMVEVMVRHDDVGDGLSGNCRARAIDPPVVPIILVTRSPTGVPTAVGVGSVGMESVGMFGIKPSTSFLQPGKISIRVIVSNSRVIFFIIKFLNN